MFGLIYASTVSGAQVPGRLARALRAAWPPPSTQPQVWVQSAQGGLAIGLVWYFSGHESVLASLVASLAVTVFTGSLQSYRLSAYGYAYKRREREPSD